MITGHLNEEREMSLSDRTKWNVMGDRLIWHQTCEEWVQGLHTHRWLRCWLGSTCSMVYGVPEQPWTTRVTRAACLELNVAELTIKIITSVSYIPIHWMEFRRVCARLLEHAAFGLWITSSSSGVMNAHNLLRRHLDSREALFKRCKKSSTSCSPHGIDRMIRIGIPNFCCVAV